MTKYIIKRYRLKFPYSMIVYKWKFISASSHFYFLGGRYFEILVWFFFNVISVIAVFTKYPVQILF